MKIKSLVFAVSLAASASASASMGNLGSTYGVLPTDIASAQALSMFNTQTSALYYNPAYLVKDPRGGIDVGLLHAEQDLTMDGGTLKNSPSQHAILGMKTNLTSLSKYNHPLYFGAMFGVEKYGKEMMSFESETSSKGQFLEYGRQPLFLMLGGGTNVWRGIDVGLSARVTLHSAATLNAVSDLGGNTEHEEMEVSARQKLTPIIGFNVNWGETLQAAEGSWLNNFETAFSYRRYSNTKTTVNSNIVIPGTVAEPGIPISVLTLDSYQPNVYSLGAMYQQNNKFRLGATLELQEWSKLGRELKKDTIKDQAVNASANKLKFSDILIGRVGGELHINDNAKFISGVAYVPSALDGRPSLDVNYLDSDKVIAGVGVSVNIQEPPFFQAPLQLDFGYQHQHLLGKNHDIYNTVGGQATHTRTAKAKGEVNVFSASASMKF